MGVQRGGKFMMVEGNWLLSEETGSTEWEGNLGSERKGKDMCWAPVCDC